MISGLDPGRMRHLVTIERPVRIANTLGELETAQGAAGWEPVVADVWAEILTLRSAEVVRAKQAQVDQTHTVRIWYVDGLSTDWRLRWLQASGDGGRILNIVGIIDVEGLQVVHEIQACESTGA